MHLIWTQIVGSLWQPEILQEAPVALRALIEGATGRDAATQLSFSPRDRTAVALCSSAVPPERAAAWVEGLLSCVDAQHIVFAASHPVRAFQCQHHCSSASPLHPKRVLFILALTCRSEASNCDSLPSHASISLSRTTILLHHLLHQFMLCRDAVSEKEACRTTF